MLQPRPRAVARSAVATALIILGSGWCMAQDNVTSFELSPGVVVDLALAQVYVMSPEGELVAVDLASGSEAWRSTEAAKPLALDGNLLIAQAEPSGPRNELEIVALDAREDGQPVTEQRIALPDGVQVSLGGGAKRTFSAEARSVAGETIVNWAFAEHTLQGIRPGGEESYLGELVASLDAAAPLGAESGSVSLADPALSVDTGEIGPQVTNGAFSIDLLTGEVAPATAAEEALEVPEALELGGPAQLAGVPQPQIVSRDGRHILSSERIADDSVWEKYRWTIYDRDTGERLGQFRTHVRVAPFFVADSRVVYETGPYARRTAEGGIEEEPRAVRAVDLATGNELWSQAVRDTAEPPVLPP